MYLPTVFLCFCGLMLSVYCRTVIERNIDCNKRPCTIYDVSDRSIMYCCKMTCNSVCCKALKDQQDGTIIRIDQEPCATTTTTAKPTTTTIAMTVKPTRTLASSSTTPRKLTTFPPNIPQSIRPKTVLWSTSRTVQTTSSSPFEEHTCPPNIVENIDCNKRPCTVKNTPFSALLDCCYWNNCQLCCTALKDVESGANPTITEHTTVATLQKSTQFPPNFIQSNSTTSGTVRTSNSPVDGHTCPPNIVRNIDCNNRPCTVKDTPFPDLLDCCYWNNCQLCCEALKDVE